MNDEIYLWHTNKLQSFLQFDYTSFVVGIQAYPKYPKQDVYISFRNFQTNRGIEVNFFLRAFKHKSFLQIDSMTLVVS